MAKYIGLSLEASDPRRKQVLALITSKLKEVMEEDPMEDLIQ